jgi:S1-C subfamily serine protease
MQLRTQDFDFDMNSALRAMVTIKSTVPSDAFTAETLGTERAGFGVVISDDGLILTVGYLVAEAETIWLTMHDGAAVPGHVLAYEYETGFGLVQALARRDFKPLPLGDSDKLVVGDRVMLAGSGREDSIAAEVAGRQEFAGYWEYVLDDAIFTTPAHPNWGGTGLIGSDGALLGIGSLMVQATSVNDEGETPEGDGQNMCIPVNIIKPILQDLRMYGRPNRPARPWLGLLATEIDGRVVIINISGHGPAKDADLRPGDLVVAVGVHEVNTLTGFFRQVWSLGTAGIAVPLQIYRDGQMLNVDVVSADRGAFLKSPAMH